MAGNCKSGTCPPCREIPGKCEHVRSRPGRSTGWHMTRVGHDSASSRQRLPSLAAGRRASGASLARTGSAEPLLVETSGCGSAWRSLSCRRLGRPLSTSQRHCDEKRPSLPRRGARRDRSIVAGRSRFDARSRDVVACLTSTICRCASGRIASRPGDCDDGLTRPHSSAPLVADRGRAGELRRDRAGLPSGDPGPMDATAAAVEWLGRAQDYSASTDGGVARHYSLLTGWGPSYPETTGYIVPTFLAYSNATGSVEVQQRARRMLDWLTSIQLDSGAFQGGTVESRPVVPVTFNTGQILLGLAAGSAAFGGPVRRCDAPRSRLARGHAGR